MGQQLIPVLGHQQLVLQLDPVTPTHFAHIGLHAQGHARLQFTFVAIGLEVFRVTNARVLVA
ncbi:hypothetical protein D3C71_2142370 [compost metagenome]